jgi:hypothetical protein
MHINATANTVILDLQNDFNNILFEINQIMYSLRVSSHTNEKLWGGEGARQAPDLYFYTFPHNNYNLVKNYYGDLGCINFDRLHNYTIYKIVKINVTFIC